MSDLQLEAREPKPLPLLLRSRDAASALQISERKLFDLAKRGAIPVVRLDKAVRFDVRDLTAYIDAHKSKGKSA